jgi:hypothetical protein
VIAYSRSLPHISSDGFKPLQQLGRSAFPNIVHNSALSRCGQGTPAGLPKVLMDGAMQQAPHPGRQAWAAAVVMPA